MGGRRRQDRGGLPTRCARMSAASTLDRMGGRSAEFASRGHVQ